VGAAAPASVDALAELVRAARSVVALTGAGVSVPSGIPDFRTPVTGLWAGVDPMEVAHIDAWRRDPERFWRFYASRFHALADKIPNGAHRALVELERRGVLRAVVTQNVDRLHAAAGTRELVEVHGSIATSSCLADGERHPLEEVVARVAAAPDGVPRCACGRPLKPDVVLFGELLPADAHARAVELAAEADLLVCVGTSLEVWPVSDLPGITRARGGRVALVTQGPTSWDGQAAVKLTGDVEDELVALVERL